MTEAAVGGVPTHWLRQAAPARSTLAPLRLARDLSAEYKIE